MEFKVSQIAQILNADIEGNADAVITTVCKIEEGIEGGLSFLANPKYTHYIYETKATAVIVTQDFTPASPIRATLIRGRSIPKDGTSTSTPPTHLAETSPITS